MQIGNLGDIITFEVSSEKVLTFDRMQRTVSGRWAKHDLINGKPKSEYIGADQQTATFSIYLSVMHGVSPRRVIDEIDAAAENGTPFTFVINGRKIGTDQWVITSKSETWDNVIEDGLLLSARLTLTLTEY